MPIYPARLTERFLELRKAANISTGTLHIFRHTYVTLSLTNDSRYTSSRRG